MDSYKYLSSVYDSLMYDVSYEKWAKYILDILKTKNIRGRLLEYACGTGSLSVYFGKEYDICCLDQSEQMLFEAQEKLRKNAVKADFVCDDMQDFLMENTFDAAVCMMDGVNYLTEGTDGFFAAAYKNIKKGGIFCFDISSFSKLTQTIGNEMFFDDGDDVTYFWQNELCGNIVNMDITIFEKKENGDYQRFDESHVQRAYAKKEILASLEKTGFKNIECKKFLTDFEGKDSDERLLFVAER